MEFSWKKVSINGMSLGVGKAYVLKVYHVPFSVLDI